MVALRNGLYVAVGAYQAGSGKGDCDDGFDIHVNVKLMS